MRITKIAKFARWIMVIIFVGCGKGEEETKSPPKVTIDPAAIEKISPVMVDDLYRSVGTVKSRTTTQLSSKVMGYVQEVKVKEGDTVKEGDLLVDLKSSELESRLEGARNSIAEIERNLSEAEAAKEEAQAHLALAEVTYQRFKELLDKQSVSTQEFDEVNAKYKVAKATVMRAEETIGSLEARKKQAQSTMEEAETYYGYTKVKAPFSGIITHKNVDEGDLAVPGNTLLVMEDNQHYQLEAIADESKVEKITIGQEIEVSLDALGEEGIMGKVVEIIPRIDPATRTFQVKIDLPLSLGIKSGMYGKAFFPIGKSSLLLVPKTALVECGQLSTLFVVNEKNQVERRLVKVGKPYEDRVEILTGLDPGESVIIRDLCKIKEGCLVEKTP